MASDKPILVFVPGGWHIPDAFAPTTSILEDAGYTCIGISLPTIGSELKGLSPQQDWGDDVTAIRDVLKKQIEEEAHDVVLIVHSYSGTVGSEACHGLGKAERHGQGKKGGISKLVYLAALVLDIGQYIWESTGGKPINEKTTIMKGDLCYADKKGVIPWFYNECSKEQQIELPEKLQSHAWKAFMSKVAYTAWRDIPGVYLLTENDNAIPLSWQEGMLAAAKGHRFELERCDSDHSPFISRPEITAKVIQQAAGERL